MAVLLSTAAAVESAAAAIAAKDDEGDEGEDDGFITALLFSRCGYMRASSIFQWLETNM